MINNKYINKKFKGGADDIVNQEERFLYNKRIYFLYKNVLDELKILMNHYLLEYKIRV